MTKGVKIGEDNLKDFFLILLFAKSVLLTQSPIDVYGSFVLDFEEPIKAITPGASIQIDVSSMISYSSNEDIRTFRKKLLKLFPKNIIRGKLITKNGQKVLITYHGDHLFNKKEVLISLYADDGIPLDKEFENLELESKIQLTSVYIYWKNYKK